jgi:hypothetical protein
MYGAQAVNKFLYACIMFENDVEMYGAQAGKDFVVLQIAFENDVEMYGAQALVKLMKS